MRTRILARFDSVPETAGQCRRRPGGRTTGVRSATTVELVTPDEVRAARERVTPVIRRTPLERADALSAAAGRRVLFKPEHRQRTGSFKIRGAYNLVSRLPGGVPVVAASAGNHAQGVALAAALTDRPATIFMPETATLPKIAATRAYGAEVRLTPGGVDECIPAAQAAAEAEGAVFVPPFDDPVVVAGQGTIGLEIADEAPAGSTVVVPVGGGGLISGVALALTTRPDVRVVGVQPEGAAAMLASVEAGRPVHLDRVETMADGVALRAPSALTLAHVQALVSGLVTVTEEEISRAVVLLLERAKAVVEPAGALGLAAVLAGKVPGDGTVVALLSGGNVDPLLLIKLIEHGLSAAGRYLVLRVVVADRPGALAALTGAVAEQGLNILSVEHRRAGLALALDQVEVVLTLETRDPDHRAETVAWLRDRGYHVDLVR